MKSDEREKTPIRYFLNKTSTEIILYEGGCRGEKLPPDTGNEAKNRFRTFDNIHMKYNNEPKRKKQLYQITPCQNYLKQFFCVK